MKVLVAKRTQYKYKYLNTTLEAFSSKELFGFIHASAE